MSVYQGSYISTRTQLFAATTNHEARDVGSVDWHNTLRSLTIKSNFSSGRLVHPSLKKKRQRALSRSMVPESILHISVTGYIKVKRRTRSSSLQPSILSTASGVIVQVRPLQLPVLFGCIRSEAQGDSAQMLACRSYIPGVDSEAGG